MSTKEELLKTELALLVAENEYLLARGWRPLSPATPGGEVLWESNGIIRGAIGAICIQRGREVG